MSRRGRAKKALDLIGTLVKGARHVYRADIFVKGTVNPTQTLDRDTIADIFAEITIEAAVAVMAVYAADSHARPKPDGSPVCDADEAAEAIILKRLAMRLPNLPVLAEEAASTGEKIVAG